MVDAADLKSVVRMDVPVQVRPGPPTLSKKMSQHPFNPPNHKNVQLFAANMSNC